MIGAFLLTVVLTSGDCPTCVDSRGVDPRGVDPRGAMYLKPAPSYSTVCHVGCNGQNCFSCSRPLYPGAIPFDYRTDFNYPWSQKPCYLPPAAPPADWYEEEVIDPRLPGSPRLPEELPAYQARRNVKAVKIVTPTHGTVTTAQKPTAPAKSLKR